MLTRSLTRADVVVCSSDATVQEITIHFPSLASKCVRIYCGADLLGAPTRIDAARVPATQETILAVGTIEPRKNYHRILDAFELLLRERDTRLIVAGAEGWQCEEVVKRLTLLERDGKAQWIRNPSDDTLRQLYGSATIFTYPSLYEGFGYPPFEAALAGVPMLVSAASAVGEIWRGHAECVEPSDAHAIMRGWSMLLDQSPDTRHAVIERQRDRANQFSWHRCATTHFDLYEQMAASRARRHRTKLEQRHPTEAHP
jgi:alpha-1,3-rhamnosyl/mannosyltransferase